MSERIGIVTGGGDCPGLNAVFRSAAKAAAKRGWETIGFLGGYEEILEPQRYIHLEYQKLGSFLTRGGSPTNFDRALCSIFGAETVELIAAGKYDQMVAYQGSQVGAVQITEATGRLKTVPPAGSLAHSTGIGDLPG